MHSILYLVYRYTEKNVNLFLSVLSDKIAEVENSNQKSLQDLLCFFPLFIQLSPSSSHILVDASFFSCDLKDFFWFKKSSQYKIFKVFPSRFG